MKNYAHKIGAGTYFVRGLLHLKAAFSLYQRGYGAGPGVSGRLDFFPQKNPKSIDGKIKKYY